MLVTATLCRGNTSSSPSAYSSQSARLGEGDSGRAAPELKLPGNSFSIPNSLPFSHTLVSLPEFNDLDAPGTKADDLGAKPG